MLALAGRRREAVLLGEARRASGAALRAALEAKSAALPRLAPQPSYAVAARERVTDATGVLAVTASDVFS